MEIDCAVQIYLEVSLTVFNEAYSQESLYKIAIFVVLEVNREVWLDFSAHGFQIFLSYWVVGS